MSRISVKLAILAASTLALTLTSAIPKDAYAYEYLCSGWRITAFDNTGCALGTQESDACGCTPSTAPQWESGLMSMFIESEGGNGISASTFVTASQNAAQSWTDISCSNMAIDASQVFSGSNTIRWGDYQNSASRQEIFFVSEESDWYDATGSGAGGTLGVTVSPWYSYGCNDRYFADSDILINGFIQGGWSSTTVEEVILHEMGHSLGLGHPCLIGYMGCPNSCVAVMAASAGDYTSPQQDDVNGLCALYPGVSGGLGSSCNGDFDCNSGPCIDYQGFSYCSQTCTTDCPTGYSCRDISDGNGNVCTRNGRPAIGDPCTSTCEEGAVCVGADGSAICHEVCDADVTNICSDGSRCVGFQGGGGACFPAGSRQEGEQCVLGDPEDDCAAGLFCADPFQAGFDICSRECQPTTLASCGSEAVCLEVFADGSGLCFDTAGLDESCIDKLCEEGLLCIGDDTTASCLDECQTNSGGADCDPGFLCASISNENNDGVCFPKGDKQEGEACLSANDCIDGLLCVGTEAGAECLVICDPSNAFCPSAGQTCLGLSNGDEGVCDPAGGTGSCDCDVTSGTCDANCICDVDCGTQCACNLSGGCDANCDCDPACSTVCSCDVGAGCSVGCDCDPGCTSQCVCDVDATCNPSCFCDLNCPCTCDISNSCDANCACDPQCGGSCACDETFYCDPSDTDSLSECECDVECPCVCDTTTACDESGDGSGDCACDIDCAPSCLGCEATSGGMAGLVVALYGFFRRRRRRLLSNRHRG